VNFSMFFHRKAHVPMASARDASALAMPALAAALLCNLASFHVAHADAPRRSAASRGTLSRPDLSSVEPDGGIGVRAEAAHIDGSRSAAPFAFGAAMEAADRISPPPLVPGGTLASGAIGRALARYAHEPTVDEVVRIALAASGLEPSRLRAAASRARASAWLPTARVGIRRGSGVDLSLRQNTTVTERAVLTTDESIAVEGSLVFHLGRAVFAREEIALLREERAVADARRELITDIVRVYYERRRLQLERDLLGRDDLERTLAIAERTAVLDGWTGGAFSRALRAGARRRPAAPAWSELPGAHP
jgi:hypothetical protein